MYIIIVNCLKKLNIIYGLSYHCLSDIPSIVAVSLGVKVLEKHVTINKKMRGPDHASSLNFNEFKNYVINIRKTEITLGKNEKKCQLETINMKSISRKSIFASKNIKKNDLFSEDNICLKRPVNGLNPIYFYDLIINKKSKFNIKKDQLIDSYNALPFVISFS